MSASSLLSKDTGVAIISSEFSSGGGGSPVSVPVVVATAKNDTLSSIPQGPSTIPIPGFSVSHTPTSNGVYVISLTGYALIGAAPNAQVTVTLLDGASEINTQIVSVSSTDITNAAVAVAGYLSATASTPYTISAVVSQNGTDTALEFDKAVWSVVFYPA